MHMNLDVHNHYLRDFLTICNFFYCYLFNSLYALFYHLIVKDKYSIYERNDAHIQCSQISRILCLNVLESVALFWPVYISISYLLLFAQHLVESFNVNICLFGIVQVSILIILQKLNHIIPALISSPEKYIGPNSAVDPCPRLQEASLLDIV